jgi:hypothetical protein
VVVVRAPGWSARAALRPGAIAPAGSSSIAVRGGSGTDFDLVPVVSRSMPDELDALSSHALHDLAVSHAKHHLNVKFFWDLLRILPAAEAAAGDLDGANADIQTMHAHIDDVTEAGQGEVAESLRPFYLEYLRKHHVTPKAS